MTMLLIDRKNARLHVAGGQLHCVSEAERDLKVPLKLLDHVVISGQAQLDTAALRQLLQAGIGISLLNVSRPGHSQVLYPAWGDDAVLRLSQYRHSVDEGLSLAISRALMHLTFHKMRRALLLWRKRYPAQRLLLTRTIRQLEALRGRIESLESLDSLRGLEGTAGRLFWQVFSALLPPAAGFVSRQRRPPPDPVNALLSLSFTLLHHRAVLVCAQQGLDPLLGFQHRPLHSRQSLACDLAEPLRPIVTDWVLLQFRQGFFSSEDFGLQNRQGCRLKKSARQRYFSSFHYELVRLQQPMSHYLRWLKKHLRTAETVRESGREL